MCCAPGSADGYRAARASNTCKSRTSLWAPQRPWPGSGQWLTLGRGRGTPPIVWRGWKGLGATPPTLHVPACSLVSVQRTRIAGHCNYLSCTFLLPLLPPWLNVDTAISSGNAMKFMRIMLLDCGPPRLSELPEATVCPRRYYTRPRTTRTLAHELYPLAAANPTGIP